jgi:hypothetical protein
MRKSATSLSGASRAGACMTAELARASRTALGAVLILAALQGPATPQPRASTPASAPAMPCPSAAVQLPVGSNIAEIVRRAAEGARFCVKAGVHRMHAITPRNNQSFHGESGAALNGSRLITEFTREGIYWVASGQTQRGERRHDVPCVPHMPRCAFPEAFFINDTPLLHVESLSQVTGGKFFFDYESSRIYFADDPRGKKVEASVSPFAFMGGAQGVLIENLLVEKYSTPIQAGAVGYNITSTGWIIQNSEIRLNSSIGIVVGTGSRVTRNYIHDNGNMGAACVGTDIIFENNDIYSNGYFSGLDTLWEGGGAKCAKTRSLIVRNNYLHSNNGIGFWTDIDNINTVYENNCVKNNINSGISHEISYSAIIRNNAFYDNGGGFHVWLWGGAIQVQNSQNVEVYGNLIVSRRGNGISLIQQDRGSGPYGPYRTINNHVHNNTIISMVPDHGGSGAVADHDIDGMKNGNNIFNSNSYHVSDLNDDHWAWVDGFYTWEEYRARSRQDADSTVRSSSPYGTGSEMPITPDGRCANQGNAPD